MWFLGNGFRPVWVEPLQNEFSFLFPIHLLYVHVLLMIFLHYIVSISFVFVIKNNFSAIAIM